MAINRFNPDCFLDWFKQCDISEKYKLVHGTWVEKGNFGAIFRCQRRLRQKKIVWETAEDLSKLPYNDLCGIAPSHMKGMGLSADSLRQKILECKSARNRNRTSSIGSNAPDSEDEEENANPIYVVKIIPIDVVENSGALKANHWMTEIEAISELRKHSHFNLLNSNHSHILQTPKIIESFRSDCAVFSVMDFINGINLSTIATTERFFSNQTEVLGNFPRTAELSFQVLQTLLGIHSSNHIHLDIKPENIMRSQLQSECLCPTLKACDTKPSTESVSDSNFDFFFDDVIDEQSAATLNNIINQGYRYTVLDFGLCSKINPCSKQDAVYLQSGRGTKVFAAPEIRECDDRDEVPYTKACDCWSLGATLYYVITAEYLQPRCDYPKHTCSEDEFMKHCTGKLQRLTGNATLQYVKRHVIVQPVNASEVVWEDSPFCLIFELTKQFDRDRLPIEKAVCHPFLRAHGLGYTPEEVVSSVRHFINTDAGISMLSDVEKSHYDCIQRSRTAGEALDLQEVASFFVEQRKNHDDNGTHNYKEHNYGQQRKMSATPELHKHGQSGAKVASNFGGLTRSKSWNGESPQALSKVKSFSSEKRSKRDVEQFDNRDVMRSNSRGAFEDRGLDLVTLIRSNSRSSVSRSDTSSDIDSSSGPGTPLSRGPSTNNFSAEKKMHELLRKKEICEQKITEISARIIACEEEVLGEIEALQEEVQSAQNDYYNACKKCHQWTKDPLPEYVKKLLWDFVPTAAKQKLDWGNARLPSNGKANRSKTELNDLIERIILISQNRSPTFADEGKNIEKCINTLKKRYDKVLQCLEELSRSKKKEDPLKSQKSCLARAQILLRNKNGKKSLDKVVEECEKILSSEILLK